MKLCTEYKMTLTVYLPVEAFAAVCYFAGVVAVADAVVVDAVVAEGEAVAGVAAVGMVAGAAFSFYGRPCPVF